MKHLLYSGGIFHDFPEMARALSEVFSGAGYTTEISDDLEHCAHSLQAGGIDLFTVYALRWTMRDGAKYEPYRERWALEVSLPARRRIEAYVRGGGGLLALHTAVICFDDWEEWASMVGGAWVWGQSSHPPLQAVDIKLAASTHSVTQGLSNFTLDDEVYQSLALREHVTVLATANTANEATWHPVVWTHEYGSGRVMCDTLGHDVSSLREPAHAALLQRGARWLTNQRRVSGDGQYA